MDIFVVSLKNALERRKHINKQFMTQQIEFQYFDAIEPHQIEGTLQNC
ncbi:glycosyltransferase family 25 protein [Acinetobacter haemolyticus]|nr:glycosyltransferase family 25 protein [Acinetobacter haemolyticus]